MRHITLSEGEFYHLYNRGVDKRVIFSAPAEYERFLAYLYLMNDVEPARHTETIKTFSRGLASSYERGEPLIAIGAYCLMPNHFHIYVTPLVENGVSKFMQRVQTAYTMFFNQKHERTGSLFQGTFKAQHVDNDAYAKYLFSYIHLNPAKLKEPKWKDFGARDFRGLREYLRTYPYSSLREYTEREYLITDPSKFPDYLASTHDIDDHINDWLESRDLPLSRGLTSRKVAATL